MYILLLLLVNISYKIISDKSLKQYIYLQKLKTSHIENINKNIVEEQQK